MLLRKFASTDFGACVAALIPKLPDQCLHYSSSTEVPLYLFDFFIFSILSLLLQASSMDVICLATCVYNCRLLTCVDRCFNIYHFALNYWKFQFAIVIVALFWRVLLILKLFLSAMIGNFWNMLCKKYQGCWLVRTAVSLLRKTPSF